MAKFHEWEIKNFTCWSGDIHGKCIGPDGLKLYPRGVGGKEHLVVIFEKMPDVAELSFIGSDGSVIYTRQPEADGRIFTGPKFKEVVAGIRKNEPLHKDRLILRWEKTHGWDSGMRFRTVIDAYLAFFHLKPEVPNLEEHKGSPNKYNLDKWNHVKIHDSRDGHVLVITSTCITGSTLEDMKVKLKLMSKEKILAQTSIWMVNDDNIMLKHEDECILVKEDVYIIPYGILLKEILGLHTVICIKIITGQCSHEIDRKEVPLSHDFRFTCVNSFPRELLPENAVTVLAKNLTSLYQDQHFSDFEVRCRTISFPTHRNILSARSPVFKAMLCTDMKEAASGHVDVIEDSDTVGRFIAFLYSGTIEDLEWEGALRLYYVADKYQVPSLKKECAAVLAFSVSLKNVCDILSLADRHQDKKLMSVARDFISENYNEVLRSENWEKFMLSDPLLAVKTVTHFGKTNYVLKKI